MDTRHIAWLDVSAGPGLADRLDAIREEGIARVAVLDASDGVAPGIAVEPVDLAAFPLPVIFAFEGALAGRAAELALSADIRACSRTASLTGPLRSDGRLRTLSGTTERAWEATGLFATGQPVAAERLLELGLVSSIAPQGKADVEARRLAGVIAVRGPIATRLAKEAIWRGLPQPLEQALRFETDLTLLLQTTKDRAEGVRAFLEKRQPVFEGE